MRKRRLVYVSCNALSQLEDARALASGYQLTALRGYDMFPQTPHMEALGAREIPRAEFVAQVAQNATKPPLPWRFDPVYWNALLPPKPAA